MTRYSAETVYQAFQKTATARPDNAFLCVPALSGRDYHPDGVEYSYGQAATAVERLKAVYAGAGFGHGHRVALLLAQRPAHFFHFLALNALGVSIVPINPDYRHDEMLYQMDHSEADLAVVLDKRLADMLAVAADRRKPLPVVTLEDFPEALPPPAAMARGGAPGLASECGLMYTSGTTGRPKGCVLTNEYCLNAGQWYFDQGGELTIRPGDDRLFNPLPAFHMNCGIISFVMCVLSANCLILPDRFHPSHWWQDLVATRATIIHYLGVVTPLLLNQPEIPEERQHNVRFGLGAGIEPELHEVFEKRFGLKLIEVWGMTETGRILADNHEPRQIHSRAFGRPLPGLEARVVDDDDNDVPVGAVGELLVRHTATAPRRAFFAEYLKNPQATEDAWRGDWFHTGDTVRQADDGMLHFVDRKKNIIRRSGENIAGAEIEACLQTHDDVAQVAVLAAPDDLRDEEVMACIVPMPDARRDAAAADRLFAWCNERLAYYKAPGWLLFVDSLPTTGTQKVQKSRIFGPDEDPRARPGIHDFRSRKKRDRQAG